ncbi:hypothetical protein J6590_034760 [Homalodisca vitripennis]|nr:hypothetical protein J6590_034760 [Homalodisca vitripennis]
MYCYTYSPQTQTKLEFFKQLSKTLSWAIEETGAEKEKSSVAVAPHRRVAPQMNGRAVRRQPHSSQTRNQSPRSRDKLRDSIARPSHKLKYKLPRRHVKRRRQTPVIGWRHPCLPFFSLLSHLSPSRTHFTIFQCSAPTGAKPDTVFKSPFTYGTSCTSIET